MVPLPLAARSQTPRALQDRRFDKLTNAHKIQQVVPLPLAPGLPADTPFGPLVRAACLSATDAAGATDGGADTATTNSAAASSGATAAVALKAVPLTRLPFRAYGCLLPEGCTGGDLFEAYTALMAAAGLATEGGGGGAAGGGLASAAAPAGAAAAGAATPAAAGPANDDGHPGRVQQQQRPGLPSYNLVATPGLAVLMPRRAESYGPVAVNSMGLAGSFFVRSREELELVRSVGPMHVLAGVGVPWGEA